MTPLDALAPDQRAVLELLLRQGRSYGDLSAMLAIPEEAVRERAHAALAQLAPGAEPPAGAANGVADWLLGQQDPAAAKRTRGALGRDPAAREWAAGVAESLRELGGERIPEVPSPKAPKPPAKAKAKPAAAKPPAEPATPPAGAPRPRPRPLRDGGAEPPRPRPAPAADAPPARGARIGVPRSSRLGGAVLIGVLALLIGGGLFLLLRDDGDDGDGSQAAAEATPTPTPTPQVVSEIVMRGAGGSEAQGLMRVFRREEDGALVFALAAEGMPPNRGREVYAVWFTKRNGEARNLGFSQAQVAQDGLFTTGGPQQDQEAGFARWLADYDTVIVARAPNANAKRPGAAVLRGTLPGGEG